MAAAQFRLLFRGGIRAGFEEQGVKEKLGEMLKLDDNGLNQMFSGRLITLKRGLKQEEATRYQQLLEKTGAEILLQSDSEQEVEAEPAAVETIEVEATPARNDASHPQAAQGQTLQCPRCAHRQQHSEQCEHCKMDLRRHLLRLERKARAQQMRAAS